MKIGEIQLWNTVGKLIMGQEYMYFGLCKFKDFKLKDKLYYVLYNAKNLNITTNMY